MHSPDALQRAAQFDHVALGNPMAIANSSSAHEYLSVFRETIQRALGEPLNGERVGMAIAGRQNLSGERTTIAGAVRRCGTQPRNASDITDPDA